MHSWKAVFRYVDFGVSSTVGPWEAGQAEGMRVLVFVLPTPCVTSTKTLPTLSYFCVGAGI